MYYLSRQKHHPHIAIINSFFKRQSQRQAKAQQQLEQQQQQLTTPQPNTQDPATYTHASSAIASAYAHASHAIDPAYIAPSIVDVGFHDVPADTFSPVFCDEGPLVSPAKEKPIQDPDASSDNFSASYSMISSSFYEVIISLHAVIYLFN